MAELIYSAFLIRSIKAFVLLITSAFSLVSIFEYILSGCVDTKLLEVRVFDEAVKRAVYKKQTEKSEQEHISNCPLCALGANANKNKIWPLKDMDADHVTAWSKGGATTIENCEMLCVTHNRSKGNR